MTEPSDVLLDNLVNGLKPVKPLRVWPLWAGAAVGLVLAAIYVARYLGPRPEMVELVRGHWPADFVVVGKPLLFLIVGVCALWGVSALVRPEGRLLRRTLAPVAVLLAVALYNLGVDIGRHGFYEAMAGAVGANLVCFSTIFCGGMVGLLVLWRLWLRKAATSHPIALGAMSGLATASLMASAYAIHCNMDAPIYILAVYGFAVAVFTGVAALLGGRFLRW